MRSFDKFSLQHTRTIQEDVRDAAARRVFELYQIPGEEYAAWEDLDKFDRDRFRTEAEDLVFVAGQLRRAGSGDHI